MTLHVTASGAKTAGCQTLFWFGTLEHTQFSSIGEGSVSYPWPVPASATEEEKWDSLINGVRVFAFPGDLLQTALDVLSTLALFEPMFTRDISESAYYHNSIFMEEYANVKMTKRISKDVDPATIEPFVQSGDFFGSRRPDGLDPMLGWAMGSSTGHVTLALRMEGQLYVVESTTDSEFWPVNGIQKTPFVQWVQQVRYIIIYKPLPY